MGVVQLATLERVPELVSPKIYVVMDANNKESSSKAVSTLMLVLNQRTMI